MLRLNVIRHADCFVRKTVFHFVNRVRNLLKRFQHLPAEQNCNAKYDNHRDDFQQKCTTLYIFVPAHDAVCRNTGEHHACHPCLVLKLLLNRHDNLDISGFIKQVGSAAALKTLDDCLRDNCFPLADCVGVLYDFQIAVYDKDTPIIQIGEL